MTNVDIAENEMEASGYAAGKVAMHLPAILSSLSDMADNVLGNDGEKEALLRAIHALRRTFNALHERGELNVAPKAKAGESVSEAQIEAASKYAEWLCAKQTIFHDVLVRVLGAADPAIQVTSLRTLMRVVARPRSGLDYPLLFSILDASVASEHFLGKDGKESQLLLIIQQEYCEAYYDVKMAVLRAVKEIAEVFAEKSKGDSEAQKGLFCRNTLALLEAVTPSEDDEDEASRSYLAGCESAAKKGKRKRASQNDFKRQFQSSWLAYLKEMALYPGVYKRVLRQMPVHVIPNFLEPLHLADYLTDSYELGDEAGIQSLQSLFILISEHGLDYPEFFQKLYALIKLPILFSKTRARFFKLLNVFLSSTHIPSYIVAAFAKRLSRLAIRGPPHSASFVLCFVFNLIRRHPNIRGLIHRQSSAVADDAELSVAQSAENEKKEKLARIRAASRRLASGNASGAIPDAKELVSDPFVEDENDLQKCRALDSSLWELKSLQSHYCPAVASLAKGVFEQHVKKNVLEFPLSDFIGLTYTTLFEQEARLKSLARGKKKKRLALEFRAPTAFTPDDAMFSL